MDIVAHTSTQDATDDLSTVLAGLSEKHQDMGRRIYFDVKRSLRSYPDTTEAYAVECARQAIVMFARQAKAGRIK